MLAKRSHSRHGDSKVLRAKQGREEANVYVKSKYMYK
jgi:hypothetical protein